MKFTWEDGFSIDVPFGTSILDMENRDRRPVFVTLTPEEIVDSTISINQLYSYLRSLANHAKL